MRLAYALLLFSFALNCFVYLGETFQIFYFTFGVTEYGLATAQPSIFGIFQLNVITAALVGTGALAIGIGAILTRSGTYALYALLIYGIGVFITQVQDFVLAIPRLIYMFDLPNFPGTTTSIAVPFVGFLGGLIVFAWGFFVMELITQRNHT